MFGFSMGEMLLLAAIALIALGPKQLPEVARTLGRFLNELRRTTGQFQQAFLDVKETADRSISTLQQSIEDKLAPPQADEPPPTESHAPGQASGEGKAVDEVGQLSFDLEKKGREHE